MRTAKTLFSSFPWFVASTNVHIMQPWEYQQSKQKLWSYHQQQQTENECLPLAYYQNSPTPNSQFNRPTNQRMLLMSALNLFLFMFLIVCFLGENQPNLTLVVSVREKSLTCEWIGVAKLSTLTSSSPFAIPITT